MGLAETATSTAGRKQAYTRAQINQTHNGQIPNVFISAGGWRCRHQWVIALDGVRAEKFEQGKHYGAIRSDLAKTKTQTVLSALDNSPALGFS